MQRTKQLLFIFFTSLVLFGCVEKYYPKQIYENENNYVVSGKVTGTGGYHVIRVSKTSSLTAPSNKPVYGCNVAIIDSDNNTFVSEHSTSMGEYYVHIEQEYLVVGKAYKVKITTPEGAILESVFDTLKPCPEIKNLYYERLDKPTSSPLVWERGIQFKVDLEANNTYDRFFHWEMEETYEYHSAFPLAYYYDGEIHDTLPVDYSMYYCWQTLPIKDFFPLSTKNFNENKFIGFNLHFVNNQTQRLMYMYSILIHQAAIGEDYYNYLEALRKNSTDQEGLFGSQPIAIKGNLQSTNQPNLKVLGFFSAENIKTRRFFFTNAMEVPFETSESCIPYVPLNGYGHPNDYPIYLAKGEDGVIGLVAKSCIDCRVLGGTTVKPSFLP